MSFKNKISISITAVAMTTTIFGFSTLVQAARALRPERAVDCGCLINATPSYHVFNIALIAAGGLFLAGLLTGAIYAVITLLKTRRFIKNILRQSPDPLAQTVFFASASGEALTFGFWRPRIAVSEQCLKTLEPAELRAVLSHEAHHVARRDPLKFFLLDILKYTFFFVPLLKNLTEIYKTAAELEADEEVADKATLGKTLLRLTEKPLGSAVASFASSLKMRLERLITADWRPKFQPRGQALLVTVIFFTGFLLLTMEKPVQSSALVCPQKEIRCLEVMSKNL